MLNSRNGFILVKQHNLTDKLYSDGNWTSWGNNSWIRQVANCQLNGWVNSRTGQLVDVVASCYMLLEKN